MSLHTFANKATRIAAQTHHVERSAPRLTTPAVHPPWMSNRSSRGSSYSDF